MKLSVSLLLLLGLSACALAIPRPTLVLTDDMVSDPQADKDLMMEQWVNPSDGELDVEQQEELHRERRQLNVQGGGSPRQGFDLSVNGRAPVWQSNNGRHSLDATGQYSQHLGGPYGNSRPNWGAGAQYTFRF